MSNISDELFERFMAGETGPEETITVLDAMKHDKELMDMYISAKRFDAMMAEEDEEVIPMEKMAAKSEDNLCDILCERYILKKMVPNYGAQSILTEAKDEQTFLAGAHSFDESEWIQSNEKFFGANFEKQWLTSDGVALYNVGRIMEGYGLSVTRQFNSDVETLKKYLNSGECLIAVVNEDILFGEEGSELPNHAVCVIAIDDDSITLYNPTTGNLDDEYPLDLFLKAWQTSKNYVVAANLKDKKIYTPHKINLDDVELDDDLEDLLEAIAENAHDVWAEKRMEEGYVYGKENNSDKDKGPLTNKDLVPYSDLPNSEKQYDRDMAAQTLKLAKRLGFKVTRTNPDELYDCPDCGKKISLEMSYCPHCGRELQLDDFVK